MAFLNGKYCIVGAGETKYSRDSGTAPYALAIEAVKNAMIDAGLESKDIDAVVNYHNNDSVMAQWVANSLGIKLNHYMDWLGGGSSAESITGLEASAIEAGLCHTVVFYRAFNGRTGARYGAGTAGKLGEWSYTAPYGFNAPSQRVALLACRHMHEFGTTSRQLGAVAVAARKHACLNPRAMMYGRPMTIEDHQNSPMISYPLHLFDCCLETDGACAMIITSAERAKNLRKPPVYIIGVAARPALPEAGWGLDASATIARTAHVFAAPMVFGQAGVTPKDIDVAELYDAFSWLPLSQLEDYGFCKKGEGGPFVEGGRIELGGEIPINTAGGMLSEGYMNGLNNVIEAVRQIRGECGERQVKNAKLALTSGCALERGAGGMILSKEGS